MKLARRGHVMPEALQANAHLVHHVADMAMSRAEVLPARAPIGQLDLGHEPPGPEHVVLIDGGRVVGFLQRSWALGHPDELARARTLGQLARHDCIVLPPEMTIFDLLAAMQRRRAAVAVVVGQRPAGAAGDEDSGPQIHGLVTKSDLAEALAEGMEMFAD